MGDILRLIDSIFDAIPDACIVCDLENRPTWWNRSFRNILGYNDDEIGALTIADFIAPEETRKTRDALEALFREGTVVLETVAVGKGGRRVPCEISGTLIRDEQGKPTAYCAMGRDVSSRKKAEEALEESRARLEATLNALPDMMFEVDRQGRIHDFRADKDAPLLMSPGQFLGKTVDELLPREPASIIMTAIQRAAQTGKYKGSVYTLELPAGLRWFELSVTTKGPAGSDDPRLIALVRDITDRQQAVRALRDERNFITAVLNTATAMVVVLDRAGRIVRFNRACERTTGYSFAEVKGKPFWDIFITPEQIESVRAKFGELKAGAFPNAMENYWLTKSGSLRLISWSNTDLVDENEVVNFIVSSGIDVTDQRAAAEALRTSEEKYRAIFESTREGIIVTDHDGVIIDANQGAATMLGYNSQKELAGMPVTSIYMYPEQRVSVVKELMKKGSSERLELTYRKRDGSPLYVLVSLLVQRDEHGDPVRYEGIFMDITERKLMEDELQKINVELDGYAHTVSHDLKGPLSAMAVAHETLDDFMKRPHSEMMREDIDELMSIIGTNLKKSVLLIQDLLALAEAGRGPGELLKVSVSEVVDGVLEERDSEISQRGIKVEVGEDLGEVIADRVHMYELFSNLVDNAIVHNSRKGLVVQVMYLGNDESGGHLYRVCDNGRGISPQLLNTLFKPFVKGDDGGTGIGLAIVQKIIETYDGRIQVFSNGGAVFEFTVRDRQDA